MSTTFVTDDELHRRLHAVNEEIAALMHLLDPEGRLSELPEPEPAGPQQQLAV